MILHKPKVITKAEIGYANILKNNKMFVCIQVETVGDKYMTVSGLPEPCTHHAKSICHLALDMLEIAGQVKVDEQPVQVCWNIAIMLFIYYKS